MSDERGNAEKGSQSSGCSTGGCRHQVSPGDTAIFNPLGVPKTIPVACAWCGKIYQIEKWAVKEGERVEMVHGACPECERRHREELKRQRQGKE